MAFSIMRGDQTLYARPSAWLVSSAAYIEGEPQRFTMDVKVQFFRDREQRMERFGCTLVERGDAIVPEPIPPAMYQRLAVASAEPTREEVYAALRAHPDFAEAEEI